MPGSGQSFKDKLANGQDCAFCPEMVVVPAGSFVMGSPGEEIAALVKRWSKDHYKSEGPQRRVTVGQAFAVGKFEVTRGQFAAFVKTTGYRTTGGCYSVDGYGKRGLQTDMSWQSPGIPQDDEHPVVCVSWTDAKAYATWLSDVTGKGYRLLTEAEWEYAARAGTTTRYHFGDTISKQQAQYSEGALGSAGKTVEVGSFPANAWGLFDMHGNVWEWVEDCWHNSYRGVPTDGRAWTTGCTNVYRVVRGGSWDDNPLRLRSALRYWVHPAFRNHNIGLRLARTIGP